MSRARTRRWSVALLALAGIALGSATASALAACSSCCDEMRAEAPAACGSIGEVACCDVPPIVQPATSSVAKPVLAMSSPVPSPPRPAATPLCDAVGPPSRSGIPVGRGVVLRL